MGDSYTTSGVCVQSLKKHQIDVATFNVSSWHWEYTTQDLDESAKSLKEISYIIYKYENHLNEWRKEGEKEGHKRTNIKKKTDVNSESSSEGEPLCRHALKFNMM